MKQQKQTKTIRKRAPKNRALAVTLPKERAFETDGTYFLKLVVFVILGTLWLKFQQPVSWFQIPLNGVPLGLLVGLLLVSRFEKYQSDRKIWYAILVIVAIISFFVPAGIVI